MSDTNLFNSVVRFVREYNYSDNLFSKSFLEYLSKHYQNCFTEKKVILSEEQEKPKSNDINDRFKSNAVKIEVDKSGSSQFVVTVTKPQGCGNQELIERYNELRYVILPPRLLTAYMTDLNNEFLSRFNKTPFRIDIEKNRIVGWKGQLLYLSHLGDYIFVDEN